MLNARLGMTWDEGNLCRNLLRHTASITRTAGGLITVDFLVEPSNDMSWAGVVLPCLTRDDG